MKRTGIFLLALLILDGCAIRLSDESLAARCAPKRGWQDGLAGSEAPAECPKHGGKLWLEAYNLGRRHHEFTAELARLDARIKGDNEADRSAARRAGLRRVRLIRELEAIRGAAQIRGWFDSDSE